MQVWKCERILSGMQSCVSLKIANWMTLAILGLGLGGMTTLGLALMTTPSVRCGSTIAFISHKTTPWPLSESLQYLGEWKWGWDFTTSFFNRLRFYNHLDSTVNSWCWSKKQWFCVSCFISLAILMQSCHISYFFPHWKLRGAIECDIIIGQNNTTLNIEQHLLLHIEHWTLRVILKYFKIKVHRTLNNEHWTLTVLSKSGKITRSPTKLTRRSYWPYLTAPIIWTS